MNRIGGGGAGGGGGDQNQRSAGGFAQSQASTFQRNKQLYLELESNLQRQVSSREFRTHFQAWMDATLAELEKQFDACQMSLNELQQGVYVGEGQYWTPKTLAHHCNLAIDERRLIIRNQPTKEHASWPELVILLHTLSSLRNRAGLTDQQKMFLENVEEEFKTVVFERREITTMTQGLSTKLSHDIEAHLAVVDTEAFQRDIDAIAPEIVELENELESALLNGDMAVAEAISIKQMDMHEHLLRLVGAQYPVIHRMFVGTQDFLRKRRWAIFRLANKDISCVVEAKMRQMEACREDMRRIEEQLVQYTQDDKMQRRRYELDKDESNRFLDINKNEQDAVWNRINELFNELCSCQDKLASLADARRNEVERRLRVEEREAGRAAGHRGFLSVAEKYMQWLQDTLDNSQAACDISRALNEFVLDGCDNVTAQFDQQQQALEEVLWLVQRAHYKYYTDFMIASGRLQYHKERQLDKLGSEIDNAQMLCELACETLDPIAKKHADLRQDLIARRRKVQEEINAVGARMRRAEDDVKPVVRAMQHRCVKHTDPREILERMNLDRLDKVLGYREQALPQVMQEIGREVQDVLLVRSALENQRAAPQPKPPGVAAIATASSTANTGPYRRFKALEPTKFSTSGDEVAAQAMSNAVVRTFGGVNGQHSDSTTEVRYTPGQPQGSGAEAQRSSGYVGRGGAPPSAGSVTSAAQALSAMRQVSAVAPTSASAAAAGAAPTPLRSATLAESVFGATSPSSVSAAAGGKYHYSSASDHHYHQHQQQSSKYPVLTEGLTCIALFPYRARAPDELSFERNDTIICIGSADEGWCNGVCSQRIGLFPTNFVQPVE